MSDVMTEENLVPAAPANITLTFNSFYDPDEQECLLVLAKGCGLREDDAEKLGVVFYEKGEFWYLPMPRADFTTGLAFDRIIKTFATFNYTVNFDLAKDPQGNVINPSAVYNLDGYKLCDEARKIAQDIIVHHHPKLASASILYITSNYTPRADDDGKFTWAWASRISGMYGWLNGYDFCITICEAVWVEITQAQKEALIDHELSHCTRSMKGSWKMRKHEVEDFVDIVRRHGDWAGDVRKLTSALAQNQQTQPMIPLNHTAKKVAEKLQQEKEAEAE